MFAHHLKTAFEVIMYSLLVPLLLVVAWRGCYPIKEKQYVIKIIIIVSIFSIWEQKAFLHCLWWWMKGRSSSYTMECKAVSSNVMCCISLGPMNWSTSIAVDMSGLLLLLLLLPLLLSSVTILKRVVASQPQEAKNSWTIALFSAAFLPTCF